MRIRMVGGPEHWKTYEIRNGDDQVEVDVNGSVYVFDVHEYKGKGVPEGRVILWDDGKVK